MTAGGDGRPRIGVIGGSGFYSLFDAASECRRPETPYGEPSGPITVSEVAGVPVAFVPRHGEQHQYPPHRINYRANLWALRDAGCDAVIGPCAAGSLQPDVHPGDFVICDQLVDRTWGRPDTYFDGTSEDGPEVVHISLADPYCPALREVAIAAARAGGITVHAEGTVVVVQGPRFSTRAESAWYRAQGWEVINMTQYPEATLARELEMCYLNVSLITDYDTGLEGMPGVEPVSTDAVVRVLNENNDRLRSVLATVVAGIRPDRSCGCRSARSGAVL